MARQSGFTIIEVLLFLAVSGLLFLIAAGTLNATIRTTRFTDATNGLENFISQQYSDVRSGVSNRASSAQSCAVGGGVASFPGAADDCIVIGRLLDFVSVGGSGFDTINVYPIVSKRCPDVAKPTENGCPATGGLTYPAADASDAGRIATYNPRVLVGAGGPETYAIQWGISLPSTVGSSQNPRYARGDGTQPRLNRIAIIHSPTSERIYTYAYNHATALSSTQQIRNTDLVRNTADRSILMCLVNPDIGATSPQFVSIGAGQSSDLITSGAARPAAQMPGGMGCL